MSLMAQKVAKLVIGAGKDAREKIGVQQLSDLATIMQVVDSPKFDKFVQFHVMPVYYDFPGVRVSIRAITNLFRFWVTGSMSAGHVKVNLKHVLECTSMMKWFYREVEYD